MTDIIKKESGGLLGMLHGQGGGLVTVPAPFERDIFLFDSYVAGTTHVEKIEELEPQLLEGLELTFVREPDNVSDPQAIRVQLSSGQKIGYVPRKDNIVFSRLMDAGKWLVGKIDRYEKRGKWLRIEIKIYLRD